MANLGKLFVSLGLDSKDFDQKMGGLQKKLGGLGGIMKGVGIGLAGMGVAAAGMGVASVKAFTDAGDEVQKMALKTGFSTEALSELKYAAELSGTNLEGLQTGIRNMSNVLLDAQNGLGTAVDALGNLGLKVEDLQGLAPEETFNKLAMAVADIEDPLQKAAIAQDLFGRSGMDLLPMLAGGSEGLAKMRQEARELGIVFSQEAADSAAQLNDSFTKIQKAFDGVMYAIAEKLVPAILPLTDAFAELVKSLPIEELGGLIEEVLPPLVDLLRQLLDAIPMESMVKFVEAALKPMFGILKALMPVIEPILGLFGKLLDLLTPVIDALGQIIEAVAELLGYGLGWLLGGLNKVIPKFEIPKFEIPKLQLPGFQSGGLITKPTLSMLGEAGPEAVLPLEKIAGLTGTAGAVTINNNIYPRAMLGTKEEVVSWMREALLILKSRQGSTAF